MRGTPIFQYTAVASIGLIPTYAGNTLRFSEAAGPFRAHPHVCGEHCPHRIRNPCPPGSSPRMRGTPMEMAEDAAFLGLIPTYAGNTTIGSKNVFKRWAHPHVCGEHDFLSANGNSFEGSSPRMRGTHPSRHIQSLLPGLIPTYAGNTRSVS